MNKLVMHKKNFPGAVAQHLGDGVHYIKNRISTITPALPIWLGLPPVREPQGDTWDIDLNDYCSGEPIITFAINTGGPPTGITLNANGTFSGTVTNVGGAGSITFTATNSNGSTNSGTLSWTIGA